MRPDREYARSDDYDREGAEWLSYSVINSVYEEERDIRSVTPHWRHRHFYEGGPWKKGPAPDREAAT